MMASLNKVFSLVTTGERWLAGLAIGTMAALLCADVFSREVFHYSLPWAQKLSLHLMIISGSLGVSLASSMGGHLRPEVGDHVLPKGILPGVAVFRELCVAGFCFFYFWI